MNLVSLILLTVLFRPDAPLIHPALKTSPDALLSIWKIGYDRAEKDRDTDRELTVVLIRRSGEQTARFQLADWQTAFEK